MLCVTDLKKEYSKNKEKVIAVDNLSFSVGKGELVGFLGANGAGKTTTVKMLCGLVAPDGGKIEICGHNPWIERKKALRNISAVLEGNRNTYWPLTVKENLEFFAALHGIPSGRIAGKISELVESLGLKDKINVPVQNLSRGMQQKLSLGVALIKDVPIIILDEPTLGLDVEAALEMRTLLKSLTAQGKTILLTTHDMHLVEAVCQRVIIINKGRIVTDENIDNVLELFKVKSYRLNLKGSLSEGQKADVLSIKHTNIEETENGVNILVDLEDTEILYAIMEILRREKIMIESINREEIDFESVFIKIVRGDK